jgi:hypothetical protein
MSEAFTQAHADFSGINGEKPPSEESLLLSAALHKAFVKSGTILFMGRVEDPTDGH